MKGHYGQCIITTLHHLKCQYYYYYSLIYSHIIYAIEAWESACKTKLDKILILQKRDMRLMTYNDTYPNVLVL